MSRDPNEVNTSGPGTPQEQSANGDEAANSPPRPFSDSCNLYEIPRVRPDDPPHRDWWIDDQPAAGKVELP